MPDLLKPKSFVAVPAPAETLQTELETVIAELHSVEIELADAGRAVQAYRLRHQDLRTTFIGIASRLDLWKKHPKLRQLESHRDHVIQRRNEILKRYACVKLKAQQT